MAATNQAEMTAGSAYGQAHGDPRLHGATQRARQRDQRTIFRLWTTTAALAGIVVSGILAQRHTTTGADSLAISAPTAANATSAAGTPDQSLFAAQAPSSGFFNGGANLAVSSGRSFGRSRSS